MKEHDVRQKVEMIIENKCYNKYPIDLLKAKASY